MLKFAKLSIDQRQLKMMSTTIKIEVLSRAVLNCPGQGGLDGNRSTSEEIDGIEKQR